MNRKDAFAAARAVRPRDLTDAQEAVVSGLAEAALAENEHPMDAVEMLMSAAAMVLIRGYGPLEALIYFRHLAAVFETAVADSIQ